MGEINRLARTYGRDHVGFVFVYLEEAHAVDEWPFAGVNDHVQQHKALPDRAAAAQLLLETFPLDEHVAVVLDNMSNDLNTALASWPFRWWVLHKGAVVLKAAPEGDEQVLSTRVLNEWLRSTFGDL